MELIGLVGLWQKKHKSMLLVIWHVVDHLLGGSPK